MAITFNSYSAEWGWLSNFAPTPITFRIDGQTYTFANVEAAYQCIRQAERTPATITPWLHLTGRQAKARSRQIRDRADWADIKVDVMRWLSGLKYRQHPDYAARLLATGEQELVHAAPWGDRFWGVDRVGAGQNMQGRVLMELRASLRKE